VTSASERAWAVFPVGSSREYNLPRELTIVLARGEGATVWGRRHPAVSGGRPRDASRRLPL